MCRYHLGRNDYEYVFHSIQKNMSVKKNRLLQICTFLLCLLPSLLSSISFLSSTSLLTCPSLLTFIYLHIYISRHSLFLHLISSELSLSLSLNDNDNDHLFGHLSPCEQL